MNDEQRLAFYEKLYFHEISIRDKLQARMQIPFTILLALFGFLSYMLKNLSSTAPSFDTVLFWVLFCLSTVFTGLAVFFFIRSWYGYSYAYLPSPKDIDEYRIKLDETYRESTDKQGNASKYMGDFIHDYFVQCTTTNTNNNDRRSYFAHRTNQSLILAFILAFFAFLPFHFGKLSPCIKESQAALQPLAHMQEVLYLIVPTNISMSIYEKVPSDIQQKNKHDINKENTDAPNPPLTTTTPPTTSSSNQIDQRGFGETTKESVGESKNVKER